MATRNVTTVFAVQGENEYRKAVQNINRSINEVNSELKLWEETYKGQENTLKAQQERTRILNELYEKQAQKIEEVQKALKNCEDASAKYAKKGAELQTALERNVGEMEKLATAGDKSSEAYTKLKEENEKLQKEISDNTAKLDAAERGVSDWRISLNKAKASLESTKNELDGTNSKLKDTGDAFGAIADVIAAAGLERALDAFLDSMEACIDKSIEFESAMAGVFKTVNMSAEEEMQLSQDIRKMAEEIPVSTTEIAGVAELAGQLGIANEDLLDFTETMVKLGTATNLSAEEAADALAKFANIAGTSSKDYERLGSAIVDLGNNFATTEADIMNMTTRLASTGSVVGLSEPQMLAVATALSSVGIEAEAGGSAISKLLKEIETSVATYQRASDTISRTGYSLRDLELMQSNQGKSFKELADGIGVTAGELGGYIDTVKNLNKYAEISGQTAEQFIQSWGNDAVLALDQFITGLGNVDQTGGNAVEVLEEMGLTEVRLSNAVLALAESDGILTDTLNVSKQAWQDNTALSEEAARRFETTESKVQILKNSVGNLLIALGDDYVNALEPAIDGTTDFVQWLSEGAEAGPELATTIATIAGALAGLTGAAAIGSGMKLIVGALSGLGPVGAGITIAATALGGLAAGIATYVANANELPAATQTLIDTNERLTESISDGKTAYDETSASIDENRDKVDGLIEKISALSNTIGKTPADEALVRSMVTELNGLLPGLGLTYDGVTEKINLSREAMLEFADETQKTAKLSAFEEYLAGLTSQQADLQVQHELTGEKIKETQKRQEEYREALDALNANPVNTREDIKAIEDLSDAYDSTFHELKQLKDSQVEIQNALKGVNSELSIAKEQYDQYASEAERAESRISKISEKISNVQTGLNDTLAREEELYSNATQAAVDSYNERVEEARSAQAEELDDFEDAQAKKLKAFQKANQTELKEYRKAQDELRDELEDRLDAEMEALEESHEAKLRMIDEEYTARLKLLDEERYNAIKEIEDQIDAIDALTEAEEKAEEERERIRRVAEAENKVLQAETIEERLEAQEELDELLLKYERERVLEERDIQKEALEAQIDALEEEYDKKEEVIKAEQKAAEEAEKAAYKAAEDALRESHEKQREILEEQLELELEAFQEKQDEKVEAYRDALDQELEDFKQNQADTLAAMEEAHNNQLLALQAHHEEQVRMAEESAQKQIEAYQRILSGANDIAQRLGNDFVTGFTKGIDELGPHAASSVRKLGELSINSLRTELDEHSPSRKARKIGQFFGEGLALGITDSGMDVDAAVHRLSTQLDIAPEVADRVRAAQAEIGKLSFGEGFAVDAAAQYRNSMAQIGRMAAQASQMGASGGVPIEITVVSTLDGQVVSRSVSRTQYASNRTVLRTNGIKTK